MQIRLLAENCFPVRILFHSENTDIPFEVKAVLCFYFYAFGDVFRRNGGIVRVFGTISVGKFPNTLLFLL